MSVHAIGSQLLVHGDVRLPKAVIGSHEGRTTLEQRFVIPGVTAKELVGLLWDSPAVGCRSLFGVRRHGAVERGRDYRLIAGLVPAPTFTFDVWLRQIPGDPPRFCVEFTQPDRKTPYLDGEFIWTFRTIDADGPATELYEQINTPEALRFVGRPLTGPRSSLRRWLFFRAGHKAVMRGLARNLTTLAQLPRDPPDAERWRSEAIA